MDDNLDEYDTIANSPEFRWIRPGLERKKYDEFVCKYRVQIQTIQLQHIERARKIIEDDHCRLDIICFNLKINDNRRAKRCLTNLMEARMREEISMIGIELETQKLVGVLVGMERFFDDKPEPDLLEYEELEENVLYIEDLRCLLIKRAYNRMSRLLAKGDKYMEIMLLCGSRNISNHFDLEVNLVDAFIRSAKKKKIRFVLVISDYRKHQLHFKSLGFEKVSEIAYGTINNQFQTKKFFKTDASTSVMCLLLAMPDKSRFKIKYNFKLKMKPPVRRVTRLKLALH